MLWVQFESCDINDASLGDGVRGNPLLLILGLANGFAVWTAMVGEVLDTSNCDYWYTVLSL